MRGREYRSTREKIVGLFMSAVFGKSSCARIRRANAMKK
jgi:hypothetical protein